MNAIDSDANTADIKNALEAAIANQRIELLYQGQNELPSKQLVGLEALCRLPESPWGQFSPEYFIPLAEASGFIVPLERLVLKQIARDFASLLTLAPKIRVGVNLSIHHVMSSDFSEFIHDWLDSLPQYSIHQLDFEITETYLQKVSSTAIEIMHSLRNKGVRIVMDDFGTGESSLSRLHTLPFDTLKLDKQFAQKIDHPMVYAIIKATIQLAKEFHIDLIAEGVETHEQLSKLELLNCPKVQGFLLSKPQPLTAWLQTLN